MSKNEYFQFLNTIDKNLDKEALKNIGYIENKTSKILSQNKRRANLKDEENDFLKAWKEPKYKNGNSTHYMNHFYNANNKERNPVKRLPKS